MYAVEFLAKIVGGIANSAHGIIKNAAPYRSGESEQGQA